MRNIYPSRNPDVVKELGDVGNEIAVYGDKLYAVINCSHYVEVMDVHTAKHIGSIDILNCRYIVFNKGKAYISSYAGSGADRPELPVPARLLRLYSQPANYPGGCRGLSAGRDGCYRWQTVCS